MVNLLLEITVDKNVMRKIDELYKVMGDIKEEISSIRDKCLHKEYNIRKYSIIYIFLNCI